MSSFIFVQPHLRFGGAERQTVIIANALAARGHDVHVVLHSGDGGLVDSLNADVHLDVLGIESHLGTPEVARRLRTVLGRLPRSLVIVKLWSSIAACAMIDRHRSVAHHVLNYCEDLDPTDHAEYIRFGALKQRIIGRVFRSRPVLSANTETVSASMVDVYRLDRAPSVIPSTVDPQLVLERSAARPVERREAFTVVSVGSLIRRKGLDVTLAALESLEVPVHWRIVGEGPLEDDLARRRAPEGLVQISLEGAHVDPYPWMAAADVVVHSARSEAWGIVLLEAMAVGTPVLAADAIGPAEMHRRLGRRDDLFELFENGSPTDLATRLRRRIGGRRVDPAEAAEYIAPFTVARATDLWERRAAELTGAPRPIGVTA